MKDVTGPKFGCGAWMQCQSGAVMGDDYRPIDGPDGSAGGLQFHAGFDQGVEVSLRGAIQSRRVPGVDFNPAVINVQAGQRGQNMLHHADLSGRPTQSRAAVCAADLVQTSRDRHGLGKIGADENDSGRRRRRAKPHPHLGAGENPNPPHLHGPGDGSLKTVSFPFHDADLP